MYVMVDFVPVRKKHKYKHPIILQLTRSRGLITALVIIEKKKREMKTQREIGSDWGISGNRIYQMLKKYGWLSRKRREGSCFVGPVYNRYAKYIMAWHWVDQQKLEEWEQQNLCDFCLSRPVTVVGESKGILEMNPAEKLIEINSMTHLTTDPDYATLKL
jgi:hypothetical protein